MNSGPGQFQAALSKYLTAFSYGNAQASDLWYYLSQVLLFTFFNLFMCVDSCIILFHLSYVVVILLPFKGIGH
jgi:hypothetical protein